MKGKESSVSGCLELRWPKQNRKTSSRDSCKVENGTISSYLPTTVVKGILNVFLCLFVGLFSWELIL
jgi:hypothetical protein